jgi:maleate cis-trans isomerase
MRGADRAGSRCARRGDGAVRDGGAALLRRAPRVVATPYPDWNNQRLPRTWKPRASRVLNVDGEPRAAAGNQGINDQSPESVVEFAARAGRPEADALLCSCTAWRSVEAVDALEQRTGKPVVTLNQGDDLDGAARPRHNNAHWRLRRLLTAA